MGWWHAPRMWPGRTVYVIGGGPSLENLDWTPLITRKTRGECRVIGVNDAYTLGSWIDAIFFGDEQWYHIHVKRGLLQWPGLIVTCIRDENKREIFPGVLVMYRIPNGIVTDKGKLGWNGSSGAAAINLAVVLGARRIVLLGFDMKLTETDDGPKANWHVNHKDPVPNPTVYPHFMKRILWMSQALDHHHPKVEVLNANPDSALECFPKIVLEDAWKC